MIIVFRFIQIYVSLVQAAEKYFFLNKKSHLRGTARFVRVLSVEKRTFNWLLISVYLVFARSLVKVLAEEPDSMFMFIYL